MMNMVGTSTVNMKTVKVTDEISYKNCSNYKETQNNTIDAFTQKPYEQTIFPITLHNVNSDYIKIRSTAMKNIGVISLIGPPGSGKSTQGKILSEKYNIPFISTGELLRKEVSNETILGKHIKPIMEKGELVPQWAVEKILRNRIIQDDAKNGFILDGSPRTIEEAKMLDKILPEMGWKNITIIEIKVSTEEVIKRLENRRRMDDSPEVIKNRIKVYEKETLPVTNYYKTQGKLYTVDGAGEIDDIAPRIILQIDAAL